MLQMHGSLILGSLGEFFVVVYDCFDGDILRCGRGRKTVGQTRLLYNVRKIRGPQGFDIDSHGVKGMWSEAESIMLSFEHQMLSLLGYWTKVWNNLDTCCGIRRG
jgi:hypothetical protein